MSTELTHHLSRLATRAPDELSLDVLLAVDLADRAAHRHAPRLGEDVVITYNGYGISSLEFADRFALDAVASGLGRPVVPDDEIPARIARQLDRSLESGRLGSLPLDLRGVSDFRVRALRTASEIPPGEVRPYGWIARQIGRPKAARAVGTAMATNRIPILLPCHRVVPSDGSLGNYGGGVERKRRLLAAEGLDVDALERRARAGVRFVGSDTTDVYCLPTCRNARRITDRHRVDLGSVDEAAALGMRPCKICRPT